MQPSLIILGGFAGVGKTTIARRLSREFNLPRFSSDVYNDALRKPLNKTFKETSPFAFDVLFHILETHLQNEVTCLLDVNMCFQRTWDTLDALMVKYPNYQLLPIILQCPLEVHQERITKRGIEEPEHLNLGGSELSTELHKLDFILNLQRSDLNRIDANRPAEEVYQDVLNVIREKTQNQIFTSNSDEAEASQ